MIVTASMHSIKNITESLSCSIDWELRLRSVSWMVMDWKGI